MRILDLFKRDGFRPKPVVLDDAAKDKWAQLLVEQRGLDEVFRTFQKTMESTGGQILTTLKRFTDEDLLMAIPDRARTMNALHGNEYAVKVKKLLHATTFTDLWSFEKEQALFFEANNALKDQSAKNIAVLHEFMHDELKATQELLQRLEDTVINFTRTTEERQFPVIRKIHDINSKLQQFDVRNERYQKLLASLASDKKRTQEKRAKLEEEIKVQLALIRNEGSLKALEQIKSIEEELFRMAAQYVSVCQDALSIYKKNPNLALDLKVKRVLEELPKDPHVFISENTESIKMLFEKIVAQFEEEQPGNVKRVIQRLTQLGTGVEQDARKIQASGPDQRALKKEMIRDIAALQVYDKQQFLLRAQAEEEALDHKIAYLEAELDPNNRLAMEREMKDLAKTLGATVKSSQGQEAKTEEHNAPGAS